MTLVTGTTEDVGYAVVRLASLGHDLVAMLYPRPAAFFSLPPRSASHVQGWPADGRSGGGASASEGAPDLRASRSNGSQRSYPSRAFDRNELA